MAEVGHAPPPQPSPEAPAGATRRGAGRGPGGWWPWAGLVAAGAALVGLVGLPLVELVSAALAEGPGHAADALSGSRTVGAAANTLWVAVAVTALAVAGATAAAWVTERSAVPGRRALRLGMLLPLLVPGYVSALSWARAYGPAGLSDRVLGVEIPGVYGPVGVVAALTVGALPLAYAVLAAALASRAEPDLERAARASGASGLAAFRTVTLPLLGPALAGASALVFVTSINAFGVPAVLGRPAGFATVTTRIYEDLVLSGDLLAFTRVLVLASALVAVALVVVGLADALVGLRLTALRTGGPSGAVAVRRRRWWPAVVLWAYLAVAVVGPLAALALVAVTQAVGLPPTPEHWTLGHFADALSGPAPRALRNSLTLAAVTAAMVVGLGALLTSLRRRAGGRLAGTAAVMTFALPGSALAVAVLLAYGRFLRDTLALMLLAYLGKLWAVGHRTIAGAADALPAEYLRAARSSGAGAVSAARTVTLPLLRPALVVAGLLAFLFAFHELTMSALLYGPGTETLAVVVLNLHQLGDVPASSALAVVVTGAVLVVAGPLLLVRRLSTRVAGWW